MKAEYVRDLMVPLADYATVSMKGTMYDAILALDRVHEFDHSHYRHRGILVYDDRDRVVGKLGLFDILTAIEGKYSEIGNLESVAGVGFSPGFIRSIFKQYSLWSRPLEQLCGDAASLRVEDAMHWLAEIEYIEADARLDLAIHQLIMGNLQSLVVTDGEEVVGIIKLSDIFRQVSLMIRSHKP